MPAVEPEALTGPGELGSIMLSEQGISPTSLFGAYA